jgi:hypothetical protein
VRPVSLSVESLVRAMPGGSACQLSTLQHEPGNRLSR